MVHVCDEMSLRIRMLYAFLKPRPLKVQGYVVEGRFFLTISLSNCLRLFSDRVVSLCLLLRNRKVYISYLTLSMTLHFYLIAVAIFS